MPLVDVIAPEPKQHLLGPSTSKINTQVTPPITQAQPDIPHAVKHIAACCRQLYEKPGELGEEKISARWLKL